MAIPLVLSLLTGSSSADGTAEHSGLPENDCGFEPARRGFIIADKNRGLLCLTLLRVEIARFTPLLRSRTVKDAAKKRLRHCCSSAAKMAANSSPPLVSGERSVGEKL